MQDAVAKGRVARGSKLPITKLTETQVFAIRASHEPYKLGKSYGVDYGTIYSILTRTTWKHIPDNGTVWTVTPRSERRKGQDLEAKKAYMLNYRLINAERLKESSRQYRERKRKEPV